MQAKAADDFESLEIRVIAGITVMWAFLFVGSPDIDQNQVFGKATVAESALSNQTPFIIGRIAQFGS